MISLDTFEIAVIRTQHAVNKAESLTMEMFRCAVSLENQKLHLILERIIDVFYEYKL